MSTQTDYSEVYREVMPSVVSIYVGTADETTLGRGAGSGFVYDSDGHIVTNHHVVAPMEARRTRGGRPAFEPVEAAEVEIRFSQGDWRIATVIGSDVHTDLAVVEVDTLPEYATPLPVATSSPDPGEPVAALGNPMGLDGSITSGIVSGSNRSMPTGGGFVLPDTVQTDAPINPGNSGGPLVTSDGVVVGVNRARQGDNIGFSVSPEIVGRVVPSLIEDGRHRHPYLKVSTLDVSPVIADANDLDEPQGILVVDVQLGPSSGALIDCAKTTTVRGREVPVGGDVIVAIDGEPVNAHEELMRYLVASCTPGETVELTVLRDGTEQILDVELAERPEPGGMIPVS